jgi:XTP/dITP diphosphohydrolase
MDLVFASGNEHKVREINSILGDSFSLIGLKDVNIVDDIPENEPDIEGNALAKARYVHQATGMDVFADDTGLEVEVLGGQPGVHSARFAGEDKDSAANIEKLLKLMGNSENRNARFRTVIALILKNREFTFEGVVDGKIAFEKRGAGGFGYDPVFVPEGNTLTFAEMTAEQKNGISHRGRAVEKLSLFLKNQL